MRIHPGKVLEANYIKPMNFTHSQFAEKIGLSRQTINKVVQGKRKITVGTAKKLSKHLNTDPEYWLKLQNDYDLGKSSEAMKEEIKQEKERRRHNFCIVPVSDVHYITHDDEREMDVYVKNGEKIELEFDSRDDMRTVMFSYISILQSENKMFLAKKV